MGITDTERHHLDQARALTIDTIDELAKAEGYTKKQRRKLREKASATIDEVEASKVRAERIVDDMNAWYLANVGSTPGSLPSPVRGLRDHDLVELSFSLARAGDSAELFMWHGEMILSAGSPAHYASWFGSVLDMGWMLAQAYPNGTIPDDQQ